MKSSTICERKIVVEMSEKEAAILMGLIQNPQCDPSQEDSDVSEFRFSMFEELKKGIGKQ